MKNVLGGETKRFGFHRVRRLPLRTGVTQRVKRVSVDHKTKACRGSRFQKSSGNGTTYLTRQRVQHSGPQTSTCWCGPAVMLSPYFMALFSSLFCVFSLCFFLFFSRRENKNEKSTTKTVATLNRGFLAQEADRLDVEEIVEMLEMENPNPKPCGAFASGSSPLAGRWQ